MDPFLAAARCAHVSIPRASPETTTYPASLNSLASARAMRVPKDDALRAPTRATVGRVKADKFPRTQSIGGASGISASKEGYEYSPLHTSLAPICAPARSSLSTCSIEHGVYFDNPALDAILGNAPKAAQALPYSPSNR